MFIKNFLNIQYDKCGTIEGQRQILAIRLANNLDDS